MKVKINKSVLLIKFLIVPKHLFKEENLWKNLAVRLHELTIKILAGQPSPIISDNNPIRIEHWDDFEDYIIS